MITAQEATDLHHRSNEDESQEERIARILSRLDTQIRAHASTGRELEYIEFLNDAEFTAVVQGLRSAGFKYEEFKYEDEFVSVPGKDGRREVEFLICW
jgi:hypothetical protein